MVAEPVQATLQTIEHFYNQTSQFVSSQQDKLAHSGYIDKLAHLNPFSSESPASSETLGYVSRRQLALPERMIENFTKHKHLYMSILTVGLGAGCYYWNQVRPGINVKEQPRSKRRAPKLANGARRDVILIIGSPTEPLTRLIALDFEKRGMIVYLTILDEKDRRFVESNPITDDINYFNLSETTSLESQLGKFQQLLELPVVPFPGAEPHNLRLVSVVFTPSLYFQAGPIENISIGTWAKINERILLYTTLFSSGLIALIRNQESKTILINPNIISTLNMPYHSPETMYQNSMKHLFTALARELSPQGLSVTQVRLGNLHISNQSRASGLKISNLVNSEVRSWDPQMKELYAEKFSKTEFKSNPIRASGGRGTSLRELYHTLFDLTYGKGRNSSVVYCGAGARSYDLVTRIFPESWIDLFLM
ncbi:DUF1776-domain-containing protein [Suhomyces tanzawaensis NRRL Y-17324]|uniref:DUF1776-domain-containing protein n=1 Tax=Suhomyces tanzawaensis NRRL Y-17324 TaxID=984487 RepID=A0A1E4SP01_9ASCO|nr:DUF1776-domain-containing protein [Suhomyces tanzawaensis NRRL Y-17324]ODV81225.1 DUF1776-domain-containing protein [Suhomyces tanzawaensis NRRL Y-17324]